MMIRTYKILSLLLTYPEKELQDFLPEVIPGLKAEGMLREDQLTEINHFVEFCSALNLLGWQEQYVQLFDFSRMVSLHLFEHVHGESRDRGQAMNDLMEEYAGAGLQPNPGELPDYLPLFLEYLSMLNAEKARELLTETVHILSAIHFRLKEKDQPYAGIFSALISLSGQPASGEHVQKILQHQKPMDFDKEYRDEPVTFGASENPCNNCH